jgi:hypothetical protein
MTELKVPWGGVALGGLGATGASDTVITGQRGVAAVAGALVTVTRAGGGAGRRATS